MELESAKRLVDILVDNSRLILAAGFGVDRAESAFFDVIELLRVDDRLRNHFLSRVEATLLQGDPGRLDAGLVPKELVELAAHELRWPEFAALASRRIADVFGGDLSLAAGDVARRVEAAYDDDWEDRMYYRRYTGGVE